MKDLPDAPWIRDAEINGVGYDEEPFFCPVCGAEEPEEVYTTSPHSTRFDIVGCSECLRTWNQYDLRDAFWPERGNSYDD